jgi:hypothetical protein
MAMASGRRFKTYSDRELQFLADARAAYALDTDNFTWTKISDLFSKEFGTHVRTEIPESDGARLSGTVNRHRVDLTSKFGQGNVKRLRAFLREKYPLAITAAMDRLSDDYDGNDCMYSNDPCKEYTTPSGQIIRVRSKLEDQWLRDIMAVSPRGTLQGLVHVLFLKTKYDYELDKLKDYWESNRLRIIACFKEANPGKLNGFCGIKDQADSTTENSGSALELWKARSGKKYQNGEPVRDEFYEMGRPGWVLPEDQRRSNSSRRTAKKQVHQLYLLGKPLTYLIHRTSATD